MFQKSYRRKLPLLPELILLLGLLLLLGLPLLLGLLLQSLSPCCYHSLLHAALSQAVEQAHELLEQQLELSRNDGEPRDDEYPADQREHDQNARDHVGGNEPRVDLEPEQSDLEAFVQHRIAHHLLNGAALFAGRHQDREDQQGYHNGREHEQLPRPLLFIHVILPPSLLCRPAGIPLQKAGRSTIS